ncbi:MAG: hypothetical protein IJR17_07310 [Clostridia bacterium]|nr:hypothetical protein [Clostridia bacterium]
MGKGCGCKRCINWGKIALLAGAVAALVLLLCLLPRWVLCFAILVLGCLAAFLWMQKQ